MEKIKQFLVSNTEIISGWLLILSAMLALCLSNITVCSDLYSRLVFLPIPLGYVPHVPLISFVNDGLMTLFFLFIGLELKFHLVSGEFQHPRTWILPAIAAVGGVTVPALIYLYFNYDLPTAKGWAIPIATDTAFMLGILSFFKNLISPQLRAFIIGFSLMDDALALLILAVFYTKSSSLLPLLACFALVSLLIILNRFKVKNLAWYLLIGAALWMAMVEANIHGTLSGIILAISIPVEINKKPNLSFSRLEHFLRPLLCFFILPLFAFINAGVNLNSFSHGMLISPITIGIALGLFIGKQCGIFLFSYGAVKKRWCHLPPPINWFQFYAISVLGGIGFTLSLFIGDLTFETDAPNYAMRSGVILGSLLSAVVGAMLLFYLSHQRRRRETIS